MKRKSFAALSVILLSISAIIVLIFSLLNIRPPVKSASTATHAIVIISLTPTATITPDPCAPENIQGTIMEFDKLSREFSDAFVLAQKTPAAQLSPIIIEMQRIHRSAEDFAAPSCLSKLREYQLGFMDTAIGMSLLLYSSFSSDVSKTMTEEQINKIAIQINQLMGQAGDLSSQYRVEMASLLGVTLTPAPTLPARVSTPTSGDAAKAP